MRRIKSFCVIFIAIVLVLGSSLVANAAETRKNFVGFEFGINYFLPNDSRFEGTGRYFSLLFPINKEFTVGVYHETGKYPGEEEVGGVKVTKDLDISINEIRVSKSIISMIEPFLGIGSASISKDLDASTIVGDIGAKVTLPLGTSEEEVKTKLSVDLLYRFMPGDATDLFGGNKAVDDLGGFGISVNFAVLF